MSQVVSQALPPVPQVPLRLYGNQALQRYKYGAKKVEKLRSIRLLR